MTTNPIKGYRVRDGKLVKVPSRMPAGQQRNHVMKASRLMKKWQTASKRGTR